MTERSETQSNFKALEERKYLDLWFELNPQAPKGRIIKSESPDFIIQNSRKRKVGIEITRWIANAYMVDGSIEKFKPSEIIPIIDKKQNKISIYHKLRFTRTILIVVLLRDGFHPFVLPQNMSHWIPSVLFDELYLLDFQLRRLYRIQ